MCHDGSLEPRGLQQLGKDLGLSDLVRNSINTVVISTSVSIIRVCAKLKHQVYGKRIKIYSSFAHNWSDIHKMHVAYHWDPAVFWLLLQHLSVILITFVQRTLVDNRDIMDVFVLRDA